MKKHEHLEVALNRRRGSVLVLVLVVVTVLTLGAYAFSEFMVSESEATAMYARQAESRAFADSAIEYVAAVMSKPESETDLNLYHNPSRFNGVILRQGETSRGVGTFAVVAPIEHDPKAASIRLGVSDESGRLNLNRLLELKLDEAQTRNLLMYLPNMTEDVADAILDWLDDDDIPREFGVESEFYEGLTPAYSAANGRFQSLDELLKVAGVTPDLLYGEDANRNGLLDPNEDDGELSAPLDNADGQLQLGWISFFTIDSKESNRRLDGKSKININNGLLTELYDTLVEEFDDENLARFVVAFRMNGPIQDPNQPESNGTNVAGGNTVAGSSGAAGRSGNSPSNTSGGNNSSGSNGSSGRNSSSSGSSGGSSGGNSGGGNSSGQNQQLSQSSLLSMADGLGKALSGDIQGAVTRGGLDLRKGGQVQVKSLYEMIGARVEAEIEGKKTELESPWSSDLSAMQNYLPDLFDRLSISNEAVIEGRINVNEARYEVLLGVPNMTEEIASGIVGSSMIGGDGQPLLDQVKQRSNTGWLVTQGIVDLRTMVKLDPYLTSRGSVVRAQVIGYFQQGGGYTRLEAVIDGTEAPAKIISVRDLTDLGRGYSSQLLNPQ